MPDETQAASSTAETDAAAPQPETAETAAEQPKTEESAPSDKPESAEDETAAASEAANRPEETTSKAERRIRQLTAQVRQLQRQMQTKPADGPPPAVREPSRPKLEQFETVEDYDKALSKYEADSKAYAIQQDRREQQAKAEKETRDREITDLRKAWDKRCDRVLKDNPDFDTSEALARVEPNPAMDGFLLDSDYGPELLDWLDQHPDDADRIRDLTPYKSVRELVKLEEKISLRVKGIRPAPAPKPPGQPAGGATAPRQSKSAADVLYG